MKELSIIFPIITHLLNICKKIKIINRESLKNIRQIILICLAFTKNFQENINLETEATSDLLYDNDNNINNEENDNNNYISRSSVFVKISNAEENNNNSYKINHKNKKATSSLYHKLKINKNAEGKIKTLTETISDYQKYFISFLSEYLKIKKNMQITKYEINIFKQFTELILRLQEFQKMNFLPGLIF